MLKSSEILKLITEKYGHQVNFKKDPEILLDIISEIKVHLQPEVPDSTPEPTHTSPFGIQWMDSWAANWMLHQQSLHPKTTSENEFSAVLGQLTELKFRQRLQDIRRFIIDHDIMLNATPDGGTPEPGTPPAGPSSIFAADDSSPEPPDGGTPEPGVPNPPAPGPTGPDEGILRNNPWILYWFVSVNTPFILDMIDAHFTRRLNDLKQHIRKG